MISYNYFGNEQKVLYEKLDNGLDVYVVPNKSSSNYYVELVVKYGSNIKEFKPLNSDKYLKLPLGVAHFLEHKMFDVDGVDPFSFYSKTGTYVNAGTNYFYTKYYIDGKKNLKKNLDYLITMVTTPYFQEEKVLSEQGIIAEEIKMYDDEADWILDYEVKKCLFKNTLNEKIAGTVSSIGEITSDILTKTYDVFYQPSNMFLVASGNVKPKEIMDILKVNNALNSRITNQPIVYKKIKEPRDVNLEYKCLEANIVVPKVSYSYKFDLEDYPFSALMTRLYLNLLFTHLFGETSEFNARIVDKKIVTDFYMDHISFDNVYALNLEAESDYADLFKDEVDNTLKNIVITEEEFTRIKKVWISIIIRSLDNKENIAYSIADDIMRDGKVSDQYEIIEKLNYSDLLKLINKIDWNNKSFVLMVPKEK